jgi:nitrate/nitrite-specific signal transduction histidine kinase
MISDSDDAIQANAFPTKSDDSAPALKKLRLVSEKLRNFNAATASQDANAAVQAQKELNQYISEMKTFVQKLDSISYWKEKQSVYIKLAPFALNLIAAPASQAFVERIFSLCSILCAGRRNIMEKSLQMRVFLKLNHRFISE